MPRGTIVVLLVLLAAALAAWLLLDGAGSVEPQGSLGVGTAEADRDRADGSLGMPDLAARGTAAASSDDAVTSPGPWGVPVVVEGSGGLPLAGARVQARSTRSMLFLGQDASRVLAAGRTDAEGRVFLADLSTPRVELNVTADGYAPRTLPVSLPAPHAQAALTRVRLWPPGTTLHVTVGNLEGAPLERASVLVYDNTYQAGRHQQELLTDTRGQVEASLGPWQQFHVLVRCPGYGAFASSGDVGTLGSSAMLDVRLAPAQEVSGAFVAQDPFRVPKDLALRVGPGPQDPPTTSHTWIEVSPEGQGRFRVWWVRAADRSTALLGLASAAYESLGAFEVDLGQPTTELELDLTPRLRESGSVAVAVTYPDGRPAAGLAIQVLRQRERGGVGYVPGVLDAQGQAELPWPKDLDPPTNVIVFDNHGIRHQLRAEDRVDGAWRMRRYGIARGQVVAADGTRPAEAVVAFYPQAGVSEGWRFMNLSQMGNWYPCDAQGEFRCDGLAPGSYHVVGGASATEIITSLAGARVVEIKAGEVTEVGVVSLQPRQLLRGHVRDAEGRPVAGVYVLGHVIAPGKLWVARAESDEEGAFALQLAHLGHINVDVADPRWSESYSADLVEPLQPLDLTLSDTPVLVVRFERRTPPDGVRASLCLSPVGEPQTHAVGGTIFGHELRVHLPANLEADTAYEGWIECGDYLGDVTPLPTDLSGPGPHVMSMWTRLPEDDDE